MGIIFGLILVLLIFGVPAIVGEIFGINPILAGLILFVFLIGIAAFDNDEHNPYI
jgi:hypothetical protein